MKGFNQAVLIGHTGKDAELKYLQNGTAVASFSLATSEKWKDDQGEVHEKTQWHQIVAWRQLAEIVGKYVKKGDALCVVGKITYEEYEKDGVKKYATKIVASEVNMLRGKRDGDSSDGSTTVDEFAAKKSAKPTVESRPMPDESDLPF